MVSYNIDIFPKSECQIEKPLSVCLSYFVMSVLQGVPIMRDFRANLTCSISDDK